MDDDQPSCDVIDGFLLKNCVGVETNITVFIFVETEIGTKTWEKKFFSFFKPGQP